MLRPICPSGHTSVEKIAPPLKCLFFPLFCIALGLSAPQLLAWASDAPEKTYAEAFKKEIELAISSLALSSEYDRIIRFWGDRVVEEAWLLAMREGPSLSDSGDMAGPASSYGKHSEKNDALVARRAIQLLDERREKTFSTLNALDALTVTKLTLKIVDAATAFECAQLFRKKPPDQDGKGRSFIALASSLSPSEFREYFGLRAKALELFINGQTEGQVLPDEETKKIKGEYQSLVFKLMKTDLRLLGYVLTGQKYSNLPDSDVCQYGRALLQSVTSGESTYAQKKSLLFVQGKLKR
jgi:hypothetical protein